MNDNKTTVASGQPKNPLNPDETDAFGVSVADLLAQIKGDKLPAAEKNEDHAADNDAADGAQAAKADKDDDGQNPTFGDDEDGEAEGDDTPEPADKDDDADADADKQKKQNAKKETAHDGKTQTPEPRDPISRKAFDKLHKRVDTLTAREYALKKENAGLKRQIEASRKKTDDEPTGDLRLARQIDAVQDQTQLDSIADKMREKRSYLRGLLKQDEIRVPDGQGGESEVQRQTVIDALENIDRALDVNVAKKRAELEGIARRQAKRQDSMKSAEGLFKWFADTQSAGRRFVDETLADPDISENLPVLIGYAWEGFLARNARQAQAAKKAVQPATKPAVAAPNAAAADKTDTGETKFNADGSLGFDSLLTRIKGDMNDA